MECLGSIWLDYAYSDPHRHTFPDHPWDWHIYHPIGVVSGSMYVNMPYMDGVGIYIGKLIWEFYLDTAGFQYSQQIPSQIRLPCSFSMRRLRTQANSFNKVKV